MGSGTIRLGGLLGIASAVAMIPAYLVGTPDAPRTPDEVAAYYESGSSFVTANGVLPLLHVLFGLMFLGVLVSMLRSASGPNSEVYVTLAGGVVFLALSAAGFAAEVAYPAALVRFGDVAVTEFGQPLLALAVWLYHYCQIGAAAMIFAASIAIWRTGVLPKWAAGGAVLGILPLLHTWLPLPAALSSLLWVGSIGLVMLTIPPVVRVESVGA
ncbi:hypothetical protein [Mycobacterium sp. IDR2000157661]|uniref:hypothetical protein n=1 Tax=Mycobacterium sp. IDR2000157661 TaxID=2867005 RepID=UPI001EEC930E|nr:hypothetical protein [Mycobacterium sp. IDR2000157661]ULE32837.1 hypothetical protein K3G64_22630 [Mycobacterium sp. IDR2000157661]